ncbi:MAG: hypothetical protein VX672_08080, partial [Planctomycetota bacterium]|nr:hypothetical protein [Planctomycetota bacterium]
MSRAPDRLQCPSPTWGGVGVTLRNDLPPPSGAVVIPSFGRFLKPRPNRRSRIAASLRPKSPSIGELTRQPAFLYGGL